MTDEKAKASVQAHLKHPKLWARAASNGGIRYYTVDKCESLAKEGAERAAMAEAIVLQRDRRAGVAGVAT